MTAKKLLRAYFYGRIFAGWKFKEITLKVLCGEIKPRKLYIQTFNSSDFWTLEPSVIFLTKQGEKCYLYEVD